MNNAGLVSITFRQHSAELIVEKAKDAGLQYIEWGSDVHVPENNLKNSERVRSLTEAAGLKISSYGTYYKLGKSMNIAPYLETAKVLGANIVRIWAGEKASGETDDKVRKNLILEAKDVCKKASKYDMKIQFEYHRNTLTDTAESALKLLEEIDESNCGLYWQPQYTRTFEENMKELDMLLPYVEIIHIFYWDESDNRLFLHDGMNEIREYIKKAGKYKKYLLEFVPDDNIEYLKQEAKSLEEVM